MNRVQWGIIEPSMIFRPAILMPCNDRSRGFNLGSFNYLIVTSIRFWIIPYSTVDIINGYAIAEVVGIFIMRYTNFIISGP